MEVLFFIILFSTVIVVILFFVLLVRHPKMLWIVTPNMINLLLAVPAPIVKLMGGFCMDHPNNDAACGIFMNMLSIYPCVAFIVSVVSFSWFAIQPNKKALIPLGFMCLWYLGIFLSFVIAIWG